MFLAAALLFQLAVPVSLDRPLVPEEKEFHVEVTPSPNPLHLPPAICDSWACYIPPSWHKILPRFHKRDPNIHPFYWRAVYTGEHLA